MVCRGGGGAAEADGVLFQGDRGEKQLPGSSTLLPQEPLCPPRGDPVFIYLF